jgi:SAM-dependent methyltransferase
MPSSGRSRSSEADFRRLLGERGETHWWHTGMRGITRAVSGEVQGRVLDIGCGPGLDLAELPCGECGIGVDLVAGPVRPARFALARGERLPFPSAHFDIVLVLDVLEQRSVQPAALLVEARRVLRPGGRLLARVPAHPALYGPHDVFWGGARRYTRDELVQQVTSAGLDLCRVTYANGLLFPFAGSLRWLARRTGAGADDMLQVPSPMERILLGLFKMEAWWLRRWNLPFGLSLICLAEAPLDRA